MSKKGFRRSCDIRPGKIGVTKCSSGYKRIITVSINRRNYFINALNEIPGVFSPMPMGAFYSIVRLPIDDSDKFCQWMLEEFEHNNATVMMAPASGFYSTKGIGKNEVRVAYVLNIDDLKAAVECLKVALTVYPGRTF